MTFEGMKMSFKERIKRCKLQCKSKKTYLSPYNYWSITKTFFVEQKKTKISGRIKHLGKN